MTETTKSVARWVSIVAHPFVMIVIMVGTAAARLRPAEEVATSIGTVAVFAILPIALLTIRQVRRGNWANVDASNPRERPILFVVGIAGVGALVLYLMIWRRDSFLLRGCLVTLVLLVVCAITTRWIKVSLHVTAATLAATGLILLGSVVGWILAAIVPVLIWSRLTLGRHQPLELALGVGFGVIAGFAMRYL